MEKRGIRSICLVLLAAWCHVTKCDLYHHMEDAFAEDTADKGKICHHSEKTVMCRLGNLQISALQKLDTCLCTHLIITDGSMAVPEWLRKTIPDFLFLMSTPLDVLAKSETAMHALVENIQKRGLDGLDVTLEGESERSEHLGVLQELSNEFGKTDSSRKLHLHLTFVNYVPSSSFIAEILSQTVVPSFTFFADIKIGRNRTENVKIMEEISKLGIPPNKTLHGISLANIGGDFEDLDETRAFQHQRCSNIPSESTLKDVPSPGGGDSPVQKLLDEVDYAKQSKDGGGIDIWSLAYDDAEGICGKGHFPILQYISHQMHEDPQPFDEFADLDIVLSTGESEEMEYLQDLSVTPEEMKKLPCERVGFYRHPLDCSKFYHCSEYRATKFNHSGPYAGFLYKCPNGLVYDERQGSCIWASLSDPCPGSGELLPVPAKKFSCTVPGFHVDPENCRWFYYCSDLGDGNLEAFEFMCPSDLLGYDEEKMLCNWKWTVPTCVNYDTQPVANRKSNATLEAQLSDNKLRSQNRNSKELRPGNTGDIFTPTHTTSKPQRIKLNPHGRQGHAVLVNNDADRSLHNNLQQLATTESSRIITENNVGIKLVDISPAQERITNERQNLQFETFPRIDSYVTTESSWSITNNTEEVKLTNSFSTQDKPTNERQDLPEKKYGTAVWRRSWINDRTQNHRTGTSQTSTSDAASRNDRLNKRRLNEGENNERSNWNDLEINNKSVLPSEADNQQERFFKGVVRKININGEIDRSFDSLQNVKNTEREISPPVKNEQGFLQSRVRDQKDNRRENTFYDISNTEFNRDFETVSVQNQPKSNPFLNVRCSKLQTGNDQTQEIGTLGCTSEVSLTIQVRRGKDPSKYTLREDKITRTALQESQRVSYVENPHETKTNNLGSDANKRMQKNNPQNFPESQTIKLNRNESPTQEIITRSAVTPSLETSSSVIFNGATYAKTLNDNSDAKSQGKFSALSLTKSQETYDIKTPDIYNHNFAHSTHRSFKDEIDTKIYNDAKNDETKKDFDNMTSLPIHFYPQGVLLNIDISQINEIPPKILLEVDNMLKTYMNEGNIDINLLGRKLNASAVSMAGKESENMEPEEIMDMIKVIENIINITREREATTTEVHNDNVDSESNQTEIDIKTVIVTTEEYENISFTTKNISDKYFYANDTDDESYDKNGQKFPLTDDRNQNSEISPNNSHPVGSNIFGRRRLIRKFRYPSIREQLERQNKFRNRPDALHQNPTFETSEKYEVTNDKTDSERNTDGQNTYIPTISTKTDEGILQPLIHQHQNQRTISQYNREQIYIPSVHQTLSRESVHRPPPVQHVNYEVPTWLNRDTSREDINQYPLPVTTPIISSKNSEIGNSRLLVTDIENSEFKSFQYNTNGYWPGSQESSHRLRKEEATQTAPSQYDRQPHAWENNGARQYDPNLYARPMYVTASYGENIHDSRQLDKKDPSFETGKFYEETYKQSPAERTLSGRAKESNAPQLPTFQYGERTKVPENKAVRDDAYVHSSFKQVSSYYSGENGEINSNIGSVPQNTARHEDKNSNFNLQTSIAETSNFQRESHFAYNHELQKHKPEIKFDVTSNTRVYNIHNTRSENLPNFREDAPNDYRQSGQSIRTNRIQAERSDYANVRRENYDRKINQVRKKRKLRILVRKLTDSASVPRHESVPMDRENNDLQQKIPKDVINALKSRILQRQANGGTGDIELQIQFQDHVWNIPFVNGQSESSLSPAICTRPGLFRHPKDCNMFYECFWDKWLQRYTLHVFSCPVKLVYDESVGGCNRPSENSSCKNLAR